jgi:hypothetical protein
MNRIVRDVRTGCFFCVDTGVLDADFDDEPFEEVLDV